MRFRVETWAPEYGSSGEGLGETEVPTDPGIEVAGAWSPIPPTAKPAEEVLFVDGVRRIDANLWIEQPPGVPVLGACASYAAGAVLCGKTARVVDARVERVLFTSALGPEDVVTRHGIYRAMPVAGHLPEEIWLRIQGQMGRLEGEVSAAHSEVELVIVDGPLSHHAHVGSAVGYVKTQHVHYLPEERRSILLDLEVGHRTPLFLISGGFARMSWYLRLAEAGGPAGGLVRCEVAANRSIGEAVEAADLVTSTLLRFASHPHKDPRAPQNLYPIAGLERELRRRLSDQYVMERALRACAG